MDEKRYTFYYAPVLRDYAPVLRNYAPVLRQDPVNFSLQKLQNTCGMHAIILRPAASMSAPYGVPKVTVKTCHALQPRIGHFGQSMFPQEVPCFQHVSIMPNIAERKLLEYLSVCQVGWCPNFAPEQHCVHRQKSRCKSLGQTLHGQLN